MVLGKLSVTGRPTIWITVRLGPIALAVGAGGSCLDCFTLIYPFFLPLFSPSPWEAARYRLKYCLKSPLNRKPLNKQRFDLHFYLFSIIMNLLIIIIIINVCIIIFIATNWLLVFNLSKSGEIF